MPERRAWPACTLALVAVALVAEALPGVARALCFERAAILAGAPWRLLSGHLVHGAPALALVDLIVLLVVGAWVESRSRALLLWTLLSSASAASLAVWFLRPDLASYVGSSALACGLVVAGAIDLARVERRGRATLVAAAALALWLAKCGLELVGAWPGAPLEPGVESVPAAHFFGGLGGALAAAVRGRGRATHQCATACESARRG